MSHRLEKVYVSIFKESKQLIISEYIYIEIISYRNSTHAHNLPTIAIINILITVFATAINDFSVLGNNVAPN